MSHFAIKFESEKFFIATKTLRLKVSLSLCCLQSKLCATLCLSDLVAFFISQLLGLNLYLKFKKLTVKLIAFHFPHHINHGSIDPFDGCHYFLAQLWFFGFTANAFGIIF